MTARQAGFVRGCGVATVLLLAAPLAAQTARFYAANASNGRIHGIHFDGTPSVLVNTDASLRVGLRGLVLRDDGPAGTQLLVCDNQRGTIVFYPHPLVNVPGLELQLTSSDGSTSIGHPDGPSLDTAGNLFFVTGGSGSAEEKALKVYRVDRNGAGNGGYATTATVLDASVPSASLEDTRIAPVSAGSVSAGDLLVLASDKVWRYSDPQHCEPDCAASRQELITLPAGTEGTGLEFAPGPELLVSTAGGAVLRYGLDGIRKTDDFASGLGNGTFKIAAGPHDGALVVAVANRNGGNVQRFVVKADGTGEPAGVVTAEVEFPVGVATTTGAVVPTPTCSGDCEELHLSDVTTIQFQKVVTAGDTSIKVFLVRNPPEGVPINLKSLDAALPDATLPAYVRAIGAVPPPTPAPVDPHDYPICGPAQGTPTLIIAEISTTAEAFDDTFAVLHGLEQLALGCDPGCLSGATPLADAQTEGRWFHCRNGEGECKDITAGCGSMLGHTRNLSAFVVARDLRPVPEIVTGKLDDLEATLTAATCIKTATRRSLQRALDKAASAFKRERTAVAIGQMEAFKSAVEQNLAAFATCSDNVAGDLVAQANSLIFFLGK